MDSSSLPQPSTSTLSSDKDSTTNKLKTPRTTRACTRCSRKKIRCLGGVDGQSCDNCLQARDGSECIFEDRLAKRGPSKTYVESLERRLDAMEKLLKSLSGEKAGYEGAVEADGDSGGAALESTYSFDRSVTGASSLADSPDADPNEDVESETADLAKDLDELSLMNDRYLGRGSGLHLARSIGKFSHREGKSNLEFKPNTAPSLTEELLLEEEVRRNHSQVYPLPPPDLAEKLVMAYFKSINSVQPLLHFPSFKRAWDFGLVETNVSFRGLFFSICALGTRFVEDERIIEPRGSALSRGLDFYQASLGSSSPSAAAASLFDIQSSCLGILWLLGAASPISAWAKIGMALRRLIDVGAHREARSRWNASPLEDQLRKRAFHVLFGFDRTISASLGRPLAMAEEDTDLREPLDIDDAALDEWNLRGCKSPQPPASTVPTPLAGIKSMMRLQRIMGRTFRSLYGVDRGSTPQQTNAVVTELDSMLNEWLNHVPDHLKWNPSEQDPQFVPQSVALYSAYYSCQILVHREFLAPPRAKLHSFPSLAICSNAARSLSHLLHTLQAQGQIQAAFYFAPFAAVTAGLILLINVFAKGQDGPMLTSSAMMDVQKCVAVLDELKGRTFIAGKCYSGLTKLATVATGASTIIGDNPWYQNTTIDSRDPSIPSLKRPSSEDSGTIPSPTESQKADKPHLEKHARRNPVAPALPFSTHDLSLATFNGYTTFSSGNAKSLAGLSLRPQYIAPQVSPLNFSSNIDPPLALPLSYAPQYGQSITPSFNWVDPTSLPQLDNVPITDEALLLETFLANGMNAGLEDNFLPPVSGYALNPNAQPYVNTPVTPSAGLEEQLGFNFDPNVPFDWNATFGGDFDFDALTHVYGTPTISMET